MAMYTQVVNKSLVPCDIASGSTRLFGESAHENVDRAGVDTEVIGDITAVRSESGVGLADEKIELPQNGQLLA